MIFVAIRHSWSELRSVLTAPKIQSSKFKGSPPPTPPERGRDGKGLKGYSLNLVPWKSHETPWWKFSSCWWPLPPPSSVRWAPIVADWYDRHEEKVLSNDGTARIPLAGSGRLFFAHRFSQIFTDSFIKVTRITTNFHKFFLQQITQISQNTLRVEIYETTADAGNLWTLNARIAFEP